MTATATEENGQAVSPGASETSAQSVTATETLEPSETPSPTYPPGEAPGDLLYTTDFQTLAGWTSFAWWKADVQDYAGSDYQAKISSYVAELRHGTYHFEVPKKYTNLAAIYEVDLGSPDVTITADSILTLDRPWTFISLICRYSEQGWYEFFIHTEGFWGIMKVSYVDGTYFRTENLAFGETDVIRTGEPLLPNQLVATCKGEHLSFTVNGVTLGSVEDDTYADGWIGVGVAAGEVGNSQVDFESLVVNVPD